MSGYRYFDKTIKLNILMSFFIKDEKLLEKYNKIWKSQQHYQKRI